MLADTDVARRHVRLVLRGARTHAEDVAGGVRLNGRPLEGQRELLPGDRLQIGQTELTFGHEPAATLLEMASPTRPPRGAPARAPSPIDLPRMSEVALEETHLLEPTNGAAPPEVAGDEPTPAVAQTTTDEHELPPRRSPVENMSVKARVAAVASDDHTRLLDRAPPPRSPPAAMPTGETRLLSTAPGARASAAPGPRTVTGEIAAALEQELEAVHSPTEEFLLPVAHPAADETTAPDGAVKPVGAIASMMTVELPARGAGASAPSSKPHASQLSPGERARLRRDAQESLGGLLRLTWSEWSPRRQRIVLGVLGGVVLGVVLGLAQLFVPKTTKVTRSVGPEPVVLGVQPTRGSFGVGPEVDFPRPDQKSFTFSVSSPSRIAAVLHYQAEYLSEGELALSINGVDQGFAPADTASARTREITLVLPPSTVRRDAANTVTFDSIRNPPAEDAWRIWNVWVELLPVPDLPPQKLLELARAHARFATEAYDNRAVSSENLFRAWKGFRDAWLSLEGLDTHSQTEMYRHVRFQLGTLEAELDRICSRLSLDFQRSMTLKQHKQARRVVEEMERVFPTAEHRCHNLARERRVELEQ